jgi:hypothetical protein
MLNFSSTNPVSILSVVFLFKPSVKALNPINRLMAGVCLVVPSISKPPINLIST